MKQQLLKSIEVGNKVKLKLEQPDIICAGRKKVECWFKGEILEIVRYYKDDILESTRVKILFKSKGKKEFVFFDNGVCYDLKWKDLKIVK